MRISDEYPHEMGLNVDGRTYAVQVFKRVTQPGKVPRLVIPAYQPNQMASGILRVCIQAIQHHTPEPHELWVVDSNSPKNNLDWLLEWPDINLVLNRTEPVPPEGRRFEFIWCLLRGQRHWGSYANAIGLELATRLIDPRAKYLMTLHMDTMPCHVGWLSFLQSALGPRVRAAGVRMDRLRVPEGVLHVLGYLVDFQLFRHLHLNFLPQLPDYDVGDRVTVMLRKAGYDVFACRNTHTDPELVDRIPSSSPLRGLYVDRTFDTSGNVIFLHLGRGVNKAAGTIYAGKTTPEEWTCFADRHLLSEGDTR